MHCTTYRGSNAEYLFHTKSSVPLSYDKYKKANDSLLGNYIYGSGKENPPSKLDDDITVCAIPKTLYDLFLLLFSHLLLTFEKLVAK